MDTSHNSIKFHMDLKHNFKHTCNKCQICLQNLTFDECSSGLLPGQEFSSDLQNQFTWDQVTEKQKEVLKNFDQISCFSDNDGLRRSLRDPFFNNWPHQDQHLLLFIFFMFQDLQLLEIFNIESLVFKRLLKRVFLCYKDVPFHNFKHCFCVTQMTYSFIHQLNLSSLLEPLDLFVLLFSALCHDLEHPGLSNGFHAKAKTELSLRYNDLSPLENHHCATAFQILACPFFNITSSFENYQFEYFRKAVIQCILGTDMAKHDKLLSRFESISHQLDFRNQHHKIMLLTIIIKTADISNEIRPPSCSSRWMDQLFDEYFKQSDLEKAKGLQVTAFMDKATVKKSASQILFIRKFLLPLTSSLSTLSKDISRKIEKMKESIEINLNNYLSQNY